MIPNPISKDERMDGYLDVWQTAYIMAILFSILDSSGASLHNKWLETSVRLQDF